MRRRKDQIGVQQLFVDLPSSRRLRTDEDVAQTQAGENHPVALHHDLARRVAPSAQPFDTSRRQGLDQLLGLGPIG